VAKRAKTLGFNGYLYLDQKTNKIIVAEVDKKTEETTYYNLTDLLIQEFVDSNTKVTISIKEEDEVKEVIEGDPFADE
jgi:hypothetical protein